MFWKYNNPSSSQLETILSKQDVTLKEVMDEEDILNECKAQNKQLLEFLIKQEVLQELVTLTTTEPPEDIDERSRFKYANIACEMITCDIPSLNERLAGDETLLSKLYAFLDREPPLNPLLASFFSKIMAVLIAKKTEQNWLSNQVTCIQVIDFLKAKDNFVQLLLNHISTSAIMDLTLKLMTQVVEVRQNILNYLDSQRIIQNLVALLDPKVDSGRHNNVAQLLRDFIVQARDNQRNSTERIDPDPLLNALESPETVALLLDHILAEEKCETAIVGGIQVLLELLDANKTNIPFAFNYPNANYDDQNDNDGRQRVVESTLKEIQKRLKDFHNLLLDPPKKASILTTVGLLEPPLGNTRLQVTRLLATLISIGGGELAQEVISLGTMSVLIDLFFAFPWNNFLHTQVQACISAALNFNLPSDQGDNIALSKHLLVNCKLVERILEAWKENDEKSETSPIGNARRGYMGHLINIANILVIMCSDTPLGIMLKDNSPETAEALRAFNENTLTEANRVREALLAGVHPHTVNEDSDEYEISFPTAGSGSQIFTDYQNQQLSLANFYDAYGAYNDEDFEFKDGEDALPTIESRSGMNFDLSEGDLVQQHELFKQVCAQNINTLDDADDQIFDEKEHTFQTVIEKDAERNSSSDSEEGDDPLMEAELWNRPNEASEAPSMIISEDPWGAKSDTASTGGSDWANFSVAVFDAKFDTIEKPNEAVAPVPENDLKIENVETEAEESPTGVKQESIDIAQLQIEENAVASTTNETSATKDNQQVQNKETSKMETDTMQKEAVVKSEVTPPAIPLPEA
ncbi:serine/threonine-protein phosphatase 6 regulatory subunit 3 isoform X1 [Atheta coriaria]|uniref:serine/threonine-protein phosphatase 6 regulatory subunit 3 isoform X1 n=1 Tax=Dalotia coriaria TaxID=877792 RepID=UPI0031F37F49